MRGNHRISFLFYLAGTLGDTSREPNSVAAMLVEKLQARNAGFSLESNSTDAENPLFFGLTDTPEKSALRFAVKFCSFCT
jgi:hypothetical protein